MLGLGQQACIIEDLYHTQDFTKTVLDILLMTQHHWFGGGGVSIEPTISFFEILVMYTVYSVLTSKS